MLRVLRSKNFIVHIIGKIAMCPAESASGRLCRFSVVDRKDPRNTLGHVLPNPLGAMLAAQKLGVRLGV